MGGIYSTGASWCRIVGPLSLWAAIGAAMPAAAVTTGTAPLGTPAQVQNGLVLTATGEVLYDSNELRTNSSSLLNGAHPDDFRYSPSASATYNHSVGRLSVSATGLAGHDFFQYNSYLDRNHFSGNGLLTYHSGSSCQAVATGNYASRQAGIRGDSTAAIDPTGNPDDVGKLVDNVQESALYGINANCGTPSGRLSFGTGYTHTLLRNGSAVRKFGDSDSDIFSGTLGVGILRPGQVSINGSYSTINYPDRLLTPGIIIPPQFRTSGVRTYRIGLSVTRPIGTRLSGTFGVSYLHAEPTGGQAPYSAPAYNVALSYTAGPRLSFQLTGLRDIIASSTAGALFRVIDQALFAAHYSLGEAITFDANAGLIQNDYKQAFAIVGEPARRSELTKTVGIGVTYAPRPLYDVTFSLTRAMRTSDPNVFNYNSNKASVVLAVHI